MPILGNKFMSNMFHTSLGPLDTRVQITSDKYYTVNLLDGILLNCRLKLNITISKIASLPNSTNSALINEFCQYMKANPSAANWCCNSSQSLA